MAKENDILKKLDGLKSNKQFNVPDGYFNALPNKILDRIKEEEQTEIPREKRPIIRLVRNQLAIAASFAALFLISYSVIQYIIPKTENSPLTQNEIFASLESEIYDLDESYLYNLAIDEKPIISSESTTLTEEEIIEYLLEDGAEFDLTSNDF